VDEKQNSLPEILAVVQVCLEGEISKDSVLSSLSQGEQKSGDLIPWTISQQFQDYEFASLSGARIGSFALTSIYILLTLVSFSLNPFFFSFSVRIATHPDYQKMGYGSRAVELLSLYYSGTFVNLDEGVKGSKKQKKEASSASSSTALATTLQEEKLQPRKDLPPLLVKLEEREAEVVTTTKVLLLLRSSCLIFYRTL